MVYRPPARAMWAFLPTLSNYLSTAYALKWQLYLRLFSATPSFEFFKLYG